MFTVHVLHNSVRILWRDGAAFLQLPTNKQDLGFCTPCPPWLHYGNLDFLPMILELLTSAPEFCLQSIFFEVLLCLSVSLPGVLYILFKCFFSRHTCLIDWFHINPFWRSNIAYTKHTAFDIQAQTVVDYLVIKFAKAIVNKRWYTQGLKGFLKTWTVHRFGFRETGCQHLEM